MGRLHRASRPSVTQDTTTGKGARSTYTQRRPGSSSSLPMISTEPAESRPSRCAVAARARTPRPRPERWQLREGRGRYRQTAPASSKSSSNATEPPRTAPHQPRLITAGQPAGGTDSDGLNRARARLLIRGSGVRVRGGAPVRHPALGLSHLIAEVHRVLAAYYDRRAGARPPSVKQTAHAL